MPIKHHKDIILQIGSNVSPDDPLNTMVAHGEDINEILTTAIHFAAERTIPELVPITNSLRLSRMSQIGHISDISVDFRMAGTDIAREAGFVNLEQAMSDIEIGDVDARIRWDNAMESVLQQRFERVRAIVRESIRQIPQSVERNIQFPSTFGK
jgi:hypothetical protein